MTVFEAYRCLTDTKYNLSKAAIYELLEFITNKNYHWLVENFQAEIENLEIYQKVLVDLQNQMPVAYIKSQKKFFKDQFYVDSRVLIPRQETELIVEEASRWLQKNPIANVVDLGTGSGVIGLSIKKYFPKTNVYLTDLFSSSLEVAKTNAQQLSLDVHYLQGNFVEPLIENKLKFDLIISNPPYIAKNDVFVQQSTKFEPQQALFATENGLKFHKEIIKNFPKIIQKPDNFCIIMEFGWQQKDDLDILVQKYLDFQKTKVEFLKDYSNNWRCIIIKNK